MDKLHVWMKSRGPVLILFIFIYAALSMYVLQRFNESSRLGNAPDNRVTLGKMVDGTAFRPFVYRALVPLIIRTVISATPEDVRQDARIGLYGSALAYLVGRMDLSYMQAVLVIILYSCLCGYVFVLYRMGEFFFPESWAMALFMPVVGLLMIPGFTFHGIYIYDFAVLFLTAACYYCMARQQWGLYFLWFFLACLNKETSIFILIFFALWHIHRFDARKYIFFLVVQSILYAVIRIALIVAFMNNPGNILEHHVYKGISSILGHYDGIRLSFYFLTLFLLTYRWQEKPLFAIYILWIYPMMVLGYTLYGFPGEYRVFFDLFPLMTVLITHTLVEGTGLAKAPLFNRLEYRYEIPVN